MKKNCHVCFYLFQQLCDIRGYVDTLMDLSEEEPDTLKLLERLCDFNLAQIRHFLKADVDMVRIPEDLDIDRQKITLFGTPEEIDAYIRYCVETVGCREGGLMMICGLYPGVPLENVKALMDAMTKYADLF